MRARRWWAWPLVPLYWVGLRVKDGLRAVGVLRVRRLGWPVVSVGSLSAGGAGKTPVVICLAGLLKERGWYVDVLSRGYGRVGGAPGVRVDPGAADAAGWFGDEPVLIARRAGVPVWVGAERFAAGRAAEAGVARGQTAGPSTALRFAQDDNPENVQREEEAEGGSCAALRNDIAGWVHLMDDGFQHRGLARGLDVVVVTAEDFEDAMLPAGNRREGLRALRRADAVVVREGELGQIEARLRGLVRAETPLWRVRRELRFPEPLGVRSAGLRPVGFCGIARPEGFTAMLTEAGCGVVETVAFGDHHRYVEADIGRLVEIARRCGATGFVTTEKDSVKLDEAMLERLRAVGPVCVVGLEVKFVDEGEVMRAVEARLS